MSRFRRLVLTHFKKSGRAFPWRTADPYKVLVSEVMLQQTQALRVVPFYNAFTKKFPTPHSLARARLADVYAHWKGLGYNRRAKYLRDAAKQIVEHHKGKVPATIAELTALPGIGPYTAAAILTFGFNQPSVVLETNIRTVFLHHFFPGRTGVADKELLPLIEAAQDKKNPRLWYSALMDYGAYLKRSGNKAHRNSAHHVRQKRFKGSIRQARGNILAALDTPKTATELSKIGGTHTRAALAALLRDGLIEKRNNRYRISR